MILIKNRVKALEKVILYETLFISKHQWGNEDKNSFEKDFWQQISLSILVINYY